MAESTTLSTEAQGTSTQLARIRASFVELPTPLPLRATPNTEMVHFPLEALTDTLRWAVEAIEDKHQCPYEIAAASVLASCSHAAQAQADVLDPIGQRIPLSLFILSVAKSSERKTSTDKLAMQATREHERFLEMAHAEELKWYAVSFNSWLAAKTQIMNCKVGKSEREQRLAEIGPEPLKPLSYQLVCSAPTIEGLMSQFRDGQPSLALFNNDGASFLGSYSMGKDFRLKTVTDLSSLWNVEPIDRTLKGEQFRIANRRLAFHLMVQPDVAKEFFADKAVRGQGFFSRLLITNPESTMGTRFQRPMNENTERKLDHFKQKLLNVYRKVPTLVTGTRNELLPEVLGLDVSATEAWVLFSDYVEEKLGKYGEYAHITDFAGKIVEHALRIAGVMTIIENPLARTISGDMLNKSALIVEYFTAQFVKAFADYEVDDETRNAELLLDWLSNAYEDDYVSLREIQQIGPNRLRVTQVAAQAIRTLIAHHWLVDAPAGATIRGKSKRSKVWLIQR